MCPVLMEITTGGQSRQVTTGFTASRGIRGGEGWGKGPEEMDWKGPGACPEGWGMGWTGGLLDSGGRSHLLSWRGPVEKSRLHFGRASEIKAESPPLRGEA